MRNFHVRAKQSDTVPRPHHALTPVKQNGQYSVVNFCIANTVVQAPFVLLVALCCCTPVYWITDMNDDPIRYVCSFVRGRHSTVPRCLLGVMSEACHGSTRLQRGRHSAGRYVFTRLSLNVVLSMPYFWAAEPSVLLKKRKNKGRT